MKKIKFLGALLLIMAGTMMVNAQSLTETYSKYGFSIQYPAGYEVEDDCSEEELTLEIMNENRLSGLVVFAAKVGEDELDMMLEIMSVEEIYEMMSGAFAAEFAGAEFGAVKKVDANTVSQTFTMSEDGITLKGKMIMQLKGGNVIVGAIMATNDAKFNLMQASFDTFKVK